MVHLFRRNRSNSSAATDGTSSVVSARSSRKLTDPFSLGRKSSKGNHTVDSYNNRSINGKAPPSTVSSSTVNSLLLTRTPSSKKSRASRSTGCTSILNAFNTSGVKKEQHPAKPQEQQPAKKQPPQSLFSSSAMKFATTPSAQDLSMDHYFSSLQMETVPSVVEAGGSFDEASALSLGDLILSSSKSGDNLSLPARPLTPIRPPSTYSAHTVQQTTNKISSGLSHDGASTWPPNHMKRSSSDPIVTHSLFSLASSSSIKDIGRGTAEECAGEDFLHNLHKDDDDASKNVVVVVGIEPRCGREGAAAVDLEGDEEEYEDPPLLWPPSHNAVVTVIDDGLEVCHQTSPGPPESREEPGSRSSSSCSISTESTPSEVRDESSFIEMRTLCLGDADLEGIDDYEEPSMAMSSSSNPTEVFCHAAIMEWPSDEERSVHEHHLISTNKSRLHLVASVPSSSFFCGLDSMPSVWNPEQQNQSRVSAALRSEEREDEVASREVPLDSDISSYEEDRDDQEGDLTIRSPFGSPLLGTRLI